MGITRKELIFRLLREQYPFDQETYYRIIEGNNFRDKKNLHSIIEETMGEYGDQPAPLEVDDDIIADILYGMNEYVCRYSAIPSFKKRLRDGFCEWARIIADRYKVSDIEKLIEEYMEEPIELDTDVAVVKGLHAMSEEEGKTKEEIAALVCAHDTKNIQNKLRQLDPTLREKPKSGKPQKRPKNVPLRFGGQIMRVGIKYKEIPIPRNDDSEKTYKVVRKYYSPDTLSPIALQLNVSQVGLLLRGMMELYNNEISNNSYEIALNIWSQLSEHCRDRIENNVYKDNKEFHRFIDDLINDETSDRIFVTEREMCEDETIETKLSMAIKMCRTCDVEYGKNCELMRKCKIRLDNYGEKPYTIINDSHKIHLSKDDIQDIRIIDDINLETK